MSQADRTWLMHEVADCLRTLGRKNSTTAATANTTMTTTSQPGTPSPSLPIDRLNPDPVNSTARMIKNACTMKPLAEVKIPELTATAEETPCFWKNRMLSVALPAVPPTSPVKALANCTPVTGPNGSRADTAPNMATACENCGSWPRTNVTHHPSPDRVLEDVAHRGDAGELSDQEIDTERARGGQEHGAEREAVELGRLRWLDTGERGARVA